MKDINELLRTRVDEDGTPVQVYDATPRYRRDMDTLLQQQRQAVVAAEQRANAEEAAARRRLAAQAAVSGGGGGNNSLVAQINAALAKKNGPAGAAATNPLVANAKAPDAETLKEAQQHLYDTVKSGKVTPEMFMDANGNPLPTKAMFPIDPNTGRSKEWDAIPVEARKKIRKAQAAAVARTSGISRKDKNLHFSLDTGVYDDLHKADKRDGGDISSWIASAPVLGDIAQAGTKTWAAGKALLGKVVGSQSLEKEGMEQLQAAAAYNEDDDTDAWEKQYGSWFGRKGKQYLKDMGSGVAQMAPLAVNPAGWLAAGVAGGLQSEALREQALGVDAGSDGIRIEDVGVGALETAMTALGGFPKALSSAKVLVDQGAKEVVIGSGKKAVKMTAKEVNEAYAKRNVLEKITDSLSPAPLRAAQEAAAGQHGIKAAAGMGVAQAGMSIEDQLLQTNARMRAEGKGALGVLSKEGWDELSIKDAAVQGLVGAAVPYALHKLTGSVKPVREVVEPPPAAAADGTTPAAKAAPGSVAADRNAILKNSKDMLKAAYPNLNVDTMSTKQIADALDAHAAKVRAQPLDPKGLELAKKLEELENEATAYGFKKLPVPPKLATEIDDLRKRISTRTAPADEAVATFESHATSLRALDPELAKEIAVNKAAKEQEMKDIIRQREAGQPPEPPPLTENPNNVVKDQGRLYEEVAPTEPTKPIDLPENTTDSVPATEEIVPVDSTTFGEKIIPNDGPLPTLRDRAPEVEAHPDVLQAKAEANKVHNERVRLNAEKQNLQDAIDSTDNPALQAEYEAEMGTLNKKINMLDIAAHEKARGVYQSIGRAENELTRQRKTAIAAVEPDGIAVPDVAKEEAPATINEPPQAENPLINPTPVTNPLMDAPSLEQLHADAIAKRKVADDLKENAAVLKGVDELLHKAAKSAAKKAAYAATAAENEYLRRGGKEGGGQKKKLSDNGYPSYTKTNGREWETPSSHPIYSTKVTALLTNPPTSYKSLVMQWLDIVKTSPDSPPTAQSLVGLLNAYTNLANFDWLSFKHTVHKTKNANSDGSLIFAESRYGSTQVSFDKGARASTGPHEILHAIVGPLVAMADTMPPKAAADFRDALHQLNNISEQVGGDTLWKAMRKLSFLEKADKYIADLFKKTRYERLGKIFYEADPEEMLSYGATGEGWMPGEQIIRIKQDMSNFLSTVVSIANGTFVDENGVTRTASKKAIKIINDVFYDPDVQRVFDLYRGKLWNSADALGTHIDAASAMTVIKLTDFMNQHANEVSRLYRDFYMSANPQLLAETSARSTRLKDITPEEMQNLRDAGSYSFGLQHRLDDVDVPHPTPPSRDIYELPETWQHVLIDSAARVIEVINPLSHEPEGRVISVGDTGLWKMEVKGQPEFMGSRRSMMDFLWGERYDIYRQFTTHENANVVNIGEGVHTKFGKGINKLLGPRAAKLAEEYYFKAIEFPAAAAADVSILLSRFDKMLGPDSKLVRDFSNMMSGNSNSRDRSGRIGRRVEHIVKLMHEGGVVDEKGHVDGKMLVKFITAQHSPERTDIVLKNNPIHKGTGVNRGLDMNFEATGFHYKDKKGKEAIALWKKEEYDPLTDKQKKALYDASDYLQDLHQEALKESLLAGRISLEQYDKLGGKDKNGITSGYKYYIPLLSEEGDNHLTMGKEAFGRTSEAADPVLASIEQSDRIMSNAQRSKFKLDFVNSLRNKFGDSILTLQQQGVSARGLVADSDLLVWDGGVPVSVKINTDTMFGKQLKKFLVKEAQWDSGWMSDINRFMKGAQALNITSASLAFKLLASPVYVASTSLMNFTGAMKHMTYLTTEDLTAIGGRTIRSTPKGILNHMLNYTPEWVIDKTHGAKPSSMFQAFVELGVSASPDFSPQHVHLRDLATRLGTEDSNPLATSTRFARKTTRKLLEQMSAVENSTRYGLFDALMRHMFAKKYGRDLGELMGAASVREAEMRDINLMRKEHPEIVKDITFAGSNLAGNMHMRPGNPFFAQQWLFYTAAIQGLKAASNGVINTKFGRTMAASLAIAGVMSLYDQHDELTPEEFAVKLREDDFMRTPIIDGYKLAIDYPLRAIYGTGRIMASVMEGWLTPEEATLSYMQLMRDSFSPVPVQTSYDNFFQNAVASLAPSYINLLVTMLFDKNSFGKDIHPEHQYTTDNVTKDPVTGEWKAVAGSNKFNMYPKPWERGQANVENINREISRWISEMTGTTGATAGRVENVSSLIPFTTLTKQVKSVIDGAVAFANGDEEMANYYLMEGKYALGKRLQENTYNSIKRDFDAAAAKYQIDFSHNKKYNEFTLTPQQRILNRAYQEIKNYRLNGQFNAASLSAMLQNSNATGDDRGVALAKKMMIEYYGKVDQIRQKALDDVESVQGGLYAGDTF